MLKVTIELDTVEQNTAQRLCDEGIGVFIKDSDSPKPSNLTIQKLIEWRLKDYLRQKRKSQLLGEAKKEIDRL